MDGTEARARREPTDKDLTRDEKPKDSFLMKDHSKSTSTSKEASFSNQILKIMRNKNESMSLSKEARKSIDKLIVQIGTEIAKKCNNPEHLTAWNLQSSLTNILPKSMVKYAIEDGTEAINNYEKNRTGNKAVRASLNLHPIQCDRILRMCNPSSKLSKESSVYMAGVLEYIVTEILVLMGNYSRKNSTTKISLKAFNKVIEEDEDICELLIINDIDLDLE